MANGNTEQSFWGNARDLGVVLVALVTLVGSADHAGYLAMLQITIGRIELSPTSLLVLGASDLLNGATAAGESAWGLLWRLRIILALIVIVVCVAYVRRSSLHRFRKTWETGSRRGRLVAGSRSVQIGVALAGFALSFVFGWNSGIARALPLAEGTEGASTVIDVKSAESSALYPKWISQPDGIHSTSIVLETADAVYLFSQVPSARAVSNGYYDYPAGELIEVPRDDIKNLTTFITGVEVKIGTESKK